MSSSRSCLAALLILTGSACRTGSAPEVDRVAILPFDNQTADVAAHWTGDGIVQIAVAQLAGAPKLAAFSVPDAQEALRARANKVVQGYWTGKGGELTLHADIRTIDGVRERSLTAQANSPSGLAHALAVELWPQAPSAPTAAAEPLRLFVEGGRARNESQLEESLREAPDFGPSWFALGQLQALRGDRAAAIETFRNAAKRPDIDPISRSRCTGTQAALAGDAPARLAALDALTRLSPSHAEPFTQAGSAAMALHRFSDAARYLEQSTRLDPGSAEPWNELGYSRALTGNFDGAVSSLREYAKRAPLSANPLDSLGEVYFLYGRFAEAEQAFLDAYTKDPGLLRAVTLRKAAEARRLGGDSAGANALFDRYKDAMARHPLAPLLQIQWTYSAGDKAGAIAAARALGEKGNSSYVWAQTAIWLAAQGQFPEAAAAGARARQTARAPSEAANALIAEFVAQPDAAAEDWSRRAESLHPAVRLRALAWGLLLHRHFKEAIPYLERLAAGAPPGEFSQFQALAGWASLESGDKAQAKKLLALWPLPSSEGSLFDSLLFPAVRLWKEKL